MQLLGEQYCRASSGVYCQSNKTEQIHLAECLRVSVLTTFSAPPQILAASTVFFCPIPETKKMMGDGFQCYFAAGLF